MALKRISTILVFLLIMSVLYAGAAFAEESTESTETTEPAEAYLERVETNMPDIKAYIRVDNAEGLTAQDVSARLEGKALVVEDLKQFHDSGEGITYIFLADISQSITPTQMKAMRDALMAFSDNLEEKDRIALVSFGKQALTLLGGSEERAAREKAIGLLMTDKEDGTAFYDAIKKAVSIMNMQTEGLPPRAVAIAISDGDDWNDGGYLEEEIDAALLDGNLPVFAIGLSEYNTGSNETLGSFGKMARESGGGIIVTGAAGLAEALDKTVAAINDCYVLYLKSSSNITRPEKQTLTVDISTGGGSFSVEKEIRLKDHIPDDTPPEVAEITQLEGQNGIRVKFSEQLIGADNKDAYSVTGQNGAPQEIQNVAYIVQGDTVYADVIFKEKPYTGKYSISFSGITDFSMEENLLTGSESFQYEGEAVAVMVTRNIFVSYWWVVFIVVIAVIILLVFRTIRKRAGLIKVEGKIGFGEAAEFKHHFTTPETHPATLIVTDVKGNAYKIDLEINKSFFVGRAKINNLSFDDKKMSRQHFAIEVEEGEYYLLDLGTTNGTFLNGVRITGKRKLVNNDVITAGNEKFVFKTGGDA